MEQKRKININILKLYEAIKKDKRKMSVYLTVAGVFGVIVAFSIPKKYTSQVMLAPETSSNSLFSSMSSLASMVGLYNDANPTGDAIYPEIYPDLMGSTTFITSLFDIKVKSQDGKISSTYYDYLTNDQKITWWSYPMIGLNKLLKAILPQKPSYGGGAGINPFYLTEEQARIMKSIQKNVLCGVDQKTNVITITVTDQDPLIAATIADSVKNTLQYFITQYRTNKARTDLEFMEKLFEESKNDYVKARQKYATFSDANTEIILETVRSKQEDLENDMQLKYNIYTQVAQQLQMAKSKVQEKTPAFTVIQPATVPLKHSNTPKVFILAVWLFIGGMLRTCILAYKNRKEIIKFE